MLPEQGFAILLNPSMVEGPVMGLQVILLFATMPLVLVILVYSMRRILNYLLFLFSVVSSSKGN
jgi:hypothetical protein